MIMFSGRGGSSSSPVDGEIYQRLCDLQPSMNRLQLVLNEMRKSQEAANSILLTIRDTLSEMNVGISGLIAAANETVSEGRAFRGAIAGVKESVEALERAHRGR